MSKGQNPHSTNPNIGSQNSPQRAIVVDCDDPLKQGRYKIRVEGHQDDLQNVPDNQLRWVPCQSPAAFGMNQTAGASPGMTIGTTILVHGMGDGQDMVIAGAVGNDGKEAGQSLPPAHQGKDGTDHVPSNDEYKKGEHGYGVSIDKMYKGGTTQFARQMRQSKRRQKRNEDPVKQGKESSEGPKHYGSPKKRKDTGESGGTIGTSMFSGQPDVQKDIQSLIQNKSAAVKNALDAMQQLKKVTGNPTSIQSIGAGNFSAIKSQLSKVYAGNKEQEQKHDCEYLKNIPDEQLSEEDRETKRICLLVEEQLRDEEQELNSANT